jgi:NADH-quinone oxidoreductase subunit A
MPGSYLPVEYLPIVLILFVSTAFGFGSLAVGYALRPRRRYSLKLMPYESGNNPIGQPRHRFYVRYYIISILFIVFDVEVIFLYPWAVSYNKIGLYAAVEMIIFIIVLGAGYVYAWKKGALRWD